MAFLSSPQHPQITIRQESLNSGLTFLRIHLQAGPLTLAMLMLLLEVMPEVPLSMPLLLESTHLTLPEEMDRETEREWICCAGEYRKCQERFKQQDGHLISWVHQYLLGAPYLIHGLAAEDRLIDTDAVVYPALSPERYERLLKKPYAHPCTAQDALNRGLITEICEPGQMNVRIETILRRGPNGGIS